MQTEEQNENIVNLRIYRIRKLEYNIYLAKKYDQKEKER